jgi:uncharacterized protein (TIGR03086 family)
MNDATRLQRFESAQQAFGAVISQVKDTSWTDPTPCTEWDVRALVNHVVGELFWATPMVDGKTIEEVGSALDGDLMGDDPQATWADSVDQSRSAFNTTGALDGTINSSMGPMPVRQYLSDLTCDLISHRWDLGESIADSQRFTSDELEQLRAMQEQLAPMAEQLVAGGYFAAAKKVPPHADEQARILAAMGRGS